MSMASTDFMISGPTEKAHISITVRRHIGAGVSFNPIIKYVSITRLNITVMQGLRNAVLRA